MNIIVQMWAKNASGNLMYFGSLWTSSAEKNIQYGQNC